MGKDDSPWKPSRRASAPKAPSKVSAPNTVPAPPIDGGNLDEMLEQVSKHFLNNPNGETPMPIAGSSSAPADREGGAGVIQMLKTIIQTQDEIIASLEEIKGGGGDSHG